MADTVNISALSSAFNSLAGTLLKGRQNEAQRELLRQRGQKYEADTAFTRSKTTGQELENADTQRAADAIPRIAPALADILFPQIERAYPERPAPVMMTKPYQATPQDGAPYTITPPPGGLEIDGPTLNRVRDVPVTKSALVDLLAPIVAQGGDAAKMTKGATDMLAGLGILFGNEDLARRSAVMRGTNAGENFAVTPGRADEVAARNNNAKDVRKQAELDARIDIAKGNNTSRETIAAGSREVRREIATMADGTKREVAIMADGTRRDIANQADLTRRDIANQRDTTRRDLRADGVTGSGGSTLPKTPRGIMQFDKMLSDRLDERTGESGSANGTARRRVRRRAVALANSGVDLNTAIEQAIDDTYGASPTVQGGGLARVFGAGPKTIVPSADATSRQKGELAGILAPGTPDDGRTPTSWPRSTHQPLPERAPLSAHSASPPVAAARPAQPARLDEKEVKAQFPDATFDERRQRWVVVRDGKTYGVR